MSDQNVNVQELQERIAQLEAANTQSKTESNTYKERFNSVNSELEAIKKKSMDGDLSKQLEHEKNERAKAEKKNKEFAQASLKEKVRNAVSKFAKDVHDLDDVMNQPAFAHILAGGIDNEKLTIDENAAKEFVNKVFEAKPWLKKNLEQAPVDTSRANASQVTAEQSVKSMSTEELDKLIFS